MDLGHDSHAQAPNRDPLGVPRYLGLSPYAACLAGAAATLLSVWVPFSPVFLFLALVCGAVSFTIGWWKPSLGFVGALITAIALVECRRLTFLQGMTADLYLLTGAQFLAVWTFAFSGLQILVRARLGGPH